MERAEEEVISILGLHDASTKAVIDIGIEDIIDEFAMAGLAAILGAAEGSIWVLLILGRVIAIGAIHEKVIMVFILLRVLLESSMGIWVSR